jgi:glycosyltransferase involved in cell wall biosynthesis
MNILLLTPQLPYPPRQGTTIRNYNLIRELASRHTFDLLTFLAPGEALTDDNPLHTICRAVFAVSQPERTLSHRGRDTLTRRLPDMGLRLESREMRELTRKLVEGNAYDIVQTEGIELAQYGELARKTAADRSVRTAWIFDDHNCEYLLQKRSATTDLRHLPRWVASAYSLVQWQKLEAYERQICRQADAVVAVSPADAEALQTLVPDLDVTVVSNGIDLDLYPYVGAEGGAGKSVQTGLTLVFTGKMDYRPNIDAVLWFGRHVLPLIQERRDDVRFQIVGMNPHPRLDELRDNPAIEITGMVPETISYIQNAAVYVIPMRVGGGTRFKALEAMASGKPIVTTTLGVEGIPVQHGQELLIAETPDAFADAVLHLLADDKATLTKREQMGISARAFVEARYGWQQITPKLEALYSRLLLSNQ